MKNKLLILTLILTFRSVGVFSQILNLPEREADAPKGSEFAHFFWTSTLFERESAIYSEVLNGNIPVFQRKLVPIFIRKTINETDFEVMYYALPDYLAIGSDFDYFLVPMTPILAQRISGVLECTLPTRKMVDQIWSAAPLKLAPSPIPPSAEMTSIPVMWQHNQTVSSQRKSQVESHPLGTLVAGNKKDVIISNAIYGNPSPGRVVIYGWHHQDGSPIQPLYSGHAETYADYSHGVRLVQDRVFINGEPASIKQILQNESLHILFSDEGVIQTTFYPLTETIPASTSKSNND